MTAALAASVCTMQNLGDHVRVALKHDLVSISHLRSRISRLEPSGSANVVRQCISNAILKLAVNLTLGLQAVIGEAKIPHSRLHLISREVSCWNIHGQRESILQWV